jgi:response regulator of citrate/malate metabolism
MRQKPAINIGGLDNLVRYFGTPEEAAELRTLRQKADRATELEKDRDGEPKPEGISTITAVALGMAIAQAGAEQTTTLIRDAEKASRATTARKQQQAQRPVVQAMRPHP